VKAQLSRMPRSGTKPEIALRRELHHRGLRFRVNLAGLPGSPDIAFTRVRLAVFIDGCFWHGCPVHYVAPKNNSQWWAQKLADNRRRDMNVDEKLVSLGWVHLHIWEHQPVVEAADVVEERWRFLRGA
jgi:DNA mismatch endonuclease (patch repair protein)